MQGRTPWELDDAGVQGCQISEASDARRFGARGKRGQCCFLTALLNAEEDAAARGQALLGTVLRRHLQP